MQDDMFSAEVPGLLISAPRSGAGKTTVALGMMRAFCQDGLRVAPFKCGPDYIDPAFHAVAAGRESYNLDSWAMSAGMIGALGGLAQGADLALAEGAMGLFDGVATAGACGVGASADIAAMRGWPVVLVLDVSGQAQSAAAVAQGFARFRGDVPVAGVILNRVASARHERLIRGALEGTGLTVFGAVPKAPEVGLPERHLGLVQAQEQADLNVRLDAMADLMRAHVDLGAVRQAARAQATPHHRTPHLLPRPPGHRIALAQDAAFSFVYPHMVAAWRQAGAEIVPFSPLNDDAPDPQADVAWLPGGYPELHAGALAAAERFKAGMRAFAQTRPVHGECGGYMALGQTLVDAAGHSHAMVGALGLVTSFAKRRMHLGYRRAVLRAPMPGVAMGQSLSGHEFHYATILEQPDAALADVTDATGAAVAESGSQRGHVTGSFFHMIAEAGAA